MTLAEAIRCVTLGHAQRIATPGKWIVWREDGIVRHKFIASNVRQDLERIS